MAEIRWFGHNCFRIRGKEATVLTDPVGTNTGYAMKQQTADIVTLSHDHQGHTNLGAVKPEFRIIKGPGEYEMHEVFITGVRTWHDDKRGEERGVNTVYVIELEGMRFAHMGDLGHNLSESHSEALDNVDVMMIPVGGGTVLSAEIAADLVSRLSPRSVIPMQFRTAKGDTNLGDVEAFCKKLGIAQPEPQDRLVIKPSDLTDTTQIFLLKPESDAVKK
jgi:L-ascorbate metabolism protein UlaG (beta-lactamase superfamily)